MTDAFIDPQLRKLLPRRAYELLDNSLQDMWRIDLERVLDAGLTSAVVAMVMLTDEDGRHPRRRIMKYLPPRERTRREFRKFSTAWNGATSAFQAHLVNVDNDLRVAIEANSMIFFMEYATLNDDHCEPLSVLLRNESLGEACEAVVRSLFDDWNGPADRQALRTTADEFLGDIARWTCGAGKPLHNWLKTSWPELLDPECEQLPGEFPDLPNPVHLARDGGALTGCSMRAFRGHSHGDLHSENILIPRTTASGRFGDFRLIDLSTYEKNFFLAYDPAYLLCSILARRMNDLPDDSGPLIELAVDGDQNRSAAFPDELREAARRIARTCRRSIAVENLTATDWDPNYLLALTGTALIFAGRKTSAGDRARRWFLTFAARAAQAALDRLPAAVTGNTRTGGKRPSSWARLIDEAGFRILVVVGPEGIGKTYAVRRRLDALRSASRSDVVVRTIDLHAGSAFGAADLVAALEEALGRGRPAVTRASGLGRDLLLGTLDPLLENADRRVVLALDAADHLIDQTRALRDGNLDDVLQFLSDRTDHDVSVVLVGRDEPVPIRYAWTGQADVQDFGPGLTLDELKAFVAALDRKGVYRAADLDDASWERLRERIGGKPRAAELAFALLDFAETELVTLGDVAAFLVDVENDDVIDVLFGATLDGLDDFQRQVLLALAVYGTAVSADAVQAAVGGEKLRRSVGTTLRHLAARNIVRLDDRGHFYLQFPDDERVLRKLGGDEIRRELGMRAEAYLANLPGRPIERLPDLWAHRARIDILIACGEFLAANRLMHRIERDHLLKWGYGWLLIEQREQIRPNLAGHPIPRMSNLNWLGEEYSEVGRLDKAQECYEEALTLARGQEQLPRRKRLLNNIAGLQFERRETSDAIETYSTALALAREWNRQSEEVAPLEGLARCYRRRGDFPAAQDSLERALSLAGGPDRRSTRVVRLLLRLARLDVECARYLAARTRLGQVSAYLDRRADPAMACLQEDIEADLQLALDDPELAFVHARRAANLAANIGDPRVFVQARTTLAAVYLNDGKLKDSRHEAEVAARRRSPGDTLLTLGMKALVLSLLRDPAAEDVFAKLRSEAFDRRDHDGRDFGAWDFEGFAICGLFLERRAALSDAEYAFDRARDICRPTGLVDRLGKLLTDLDQGTGRLAPAIASALRDPRSRSAA